MLYAHILVSTDFSSAVNRALVYAFEEATQHQAKLTLLHVLQHHPATKVYYIKDAPQSGTGYAEFGKKLPAFPAQPPETVRRDYYEGALVQLQALVPASFTGACEVQVAAGPPAEAIVHMTQELAVDLMIIFGHQVMALLCYAISVRPFPVRVGSS